MCVFYAFWSFVWGSGGIAGLKQRNKQKAQWILGEQCLLSYFQSYMSLEAFEQKSTIFYLFTPALWWAPMWPVKDVCCSMLLDYPRPFQRGLSLEPQLCFSLFQRGAGLNTQLNGLSRNKLWEIPILCFDHIYRLPPPPTPPHPTPPHTYLKTLSLLYTQSQGGESPELRGW